MVYRAITLIVCGWLSGPGLDCGQMSKPILKAFGSNARRLRLKRKLTQEQLAELSSLHPNYIGGIERGERNLSLVNIVRLTRALQCRIGDLFATISTADKLGS